MPAGRGPAIELPLPMQGMLAGLVPQADGAGVIFGMEDYFTATRWFGAQAAVSPLGLDPGKLCGNSGSGPASRVSADGTRVPLAILLPPGARRDGSLPMLLLGYGSYGASNTEPGYGYFTFGLLEEGGAIGLCGTRGGGERGRSWHEAGRAANKPMRMPT